VGLFYNDNTHGPRNPHRAKLRRNRPIKQKLKVRVEIIPNRRLWHNGYITHNDKLPTIHHCTLSHKIYLYIVHTVINGAVSLNFCFFMKNAVYSLLIHKILTRNGITYWMLNILNGGQSLVCTLLCCEWANGGTGHGVARR